jgi:hypothetical protein
MEPWTEHPLDVWPPRRVFPADQVQEEPVNVLHAFRADVWEAVHALQAEVAQERALRVRAEVTTRTLQAELAVLRREMEELRGLVELVVEEVG